MGEGVVIVTGGSGGIGAAVALRLAGEGSRVCISYLSNEAKARDIVERAPAGSMMAVRADLGREEDILALFGEVDRKLGRPTGLVNNAAVIGVESRVDSVRAEDLAALWVTNITGYLLCTREAVKRMSKRHGGDGGAIVNVSSMAGVRGGGDQRVAYGASKGAVNAMTMGLGRELVADGIRVNAVCPGYVETDVHRAVPGRWEKFERAVQTVPMKRAGRPEEVADAVSWLLSPRASFVTGTLVNVAGGA